MTVFHGSSPELSGTSMRRPGGHAWSGVLVGVGMTIVVVSAGCLWLVRDFETFPIDRNGWQISNAATLCAPGADPRYYWSKILILADLIVVALFACVLLFCRHVWRISVVGSGMRALAVVFSVVAALGVIAGVWSLIFDVIYGFWGFVPHCPPG